MEGAGKVLHYEEETKQSYWEDVSYCGAFGQEEENCKYGAA